MSSKKVLILGVTGMLGHTLFDSLGRNPKYEVLGTVRNARGLDAFFSTGQLSNVIPNVEASQPQTIQRIISAVHPDVIINCIGIIKQLPSAHDPVTAISINALLPHQLVAFCNDRSTRVIQISTDCVFDGIAGQYTEQDPPNAKDLYGRTKLLGELVEAPSGITLRTSIIGHELKTRVGLVEWFLSQTGSVKGYTNAIYTGFPTIELARIIEAYVIPNEALSGLYQVASQPIDKYTLLQLIAQRYGKVIEIRPDSTFFCDRSLKASRFNEVTGYRPPSWPELVEVMHRHFIHSPFYTHVQPA